MVLLWTNSGNIVKDDYYDVYLWNHCNRYDSINLFAFLTVMQDFIVFCIEIYYIY